MPRSEKGGREPWCLALALILVFAALCRVAAIVEVGDTLVLHGDEGYYVTAAGSLVRGQGYPGSERPPGYPAFLAAAFALTGGSLTAARLAQVAVSLVAVALVFDLVRRRFGARAAALSALLVAAHPTLVHYTHFLWSETLVATLLVAIVWVLDRFDATRKVPWLIAAGALLGAAVLTRELLLYAVPIAAVWAGAGRGADRRTAVWRALLVLAPAAAVVLPWTVRNYGLHGRFVLVSNMRWMPIAQGNLLPQGRLLGAGPGEEFPRLYREVAGELEREAFARRVALEAIRAEQPWWIARKLARNGFLLFAPVSQLTRYARREWLPLEVQPFAHRLIALEMTFYVTAMLVGIAALWLVPGGRTKVLVVALLVLHLAIYTVANANHRFRVPLLPLFALYAGPLLCGRVAYGRGRAIRIAGAALCVGAFLAVLAAHFSAAGGIAAWTAAGGGPGIEGGSASGDAD